MHTIERISGPFGRERLSIRSFKDTSAMHEFLNKGANACTWRESTKGLKPGMYAYVGGQWHNTRTLDPVTLAHV